MPTKKPRTKKPAKTDAAALLAHFGAQPPGAPGGRVGLPKRGEPAAWDDEFDRLVDGPATPTLVGTHWVNAKKEFWRFEGDGKLTYGLSGGIFSLEWTQRGPWLFLVNVAGPTRTAEILARVEGDAIAGYHRTQFGVNTIAYQRTDAAVIDEYITSKQAFQAWLLGPRDTPQPPMPPWPPRSSRPAAASRSAAKPPLRFTNHRAERAFAVMNSVEQTHLAAHAATIAEQAEFGGVHAIDLVDGDKVVYQLYWWPFTDGILVDAASGAVVADLLDGSLAIEDATLRARVDAGYRAARADGSLPISIKLT